MSASTGIQFLNFDKRPVPLGYSLMAVVPAGMSIYAFSGQVGVDSQGRVPKDIECQYRQALKNLMQLLESEGLNGSNLVKLNTWAVGPIDVQLMQSIRLEVLGVNTAPATLVFVSGLGRDDMLIEIDAWAAG